MRVAEAAKKRLGFWGYAAIIAGLIVVLLLAAIAALYIQRRSVVALIAQNYLRTLGVESEISFSTLGIGGFLARVRAGKVDQPDFTAESMEVTLTYPNDGMTPALATVRLVRPFMRVGYDGKKLSFGSLQKLIDEAMTQKPAGEGPSVVIEKGDLLLVTPDGDLRFTADLTIANRRLMHLNASLQGGRLVVQGIEAVLAAATVKADARGDSMDGSATVKLDSLVQGANYARGIELAAELGGLKWQGADNAYRFSFTGAALTARSADIVAPGLSAMGSETHIAVQDGEGMFDNGRIDAKAKGNADVRLDVARFGDLVAAARVDEHMVLDSATMHFADGGLGIAAAARSKLEATDMRSGAVSLAGLAMDAAMPDLAVDIAPAGLTLRSAPRLVLDGKGLRYRLKDGAVAVPAFHADVTAKGALRDGKPSGTARLSLNAPVNIPRAVSAGYARSLGDAALAAAIVDALESATLQIRDADIGFGDTIVFASRAPVVLDGARGAKITLSPRETVPFVKMGTAGESTGAMAVAVEGGGLPPTHLTFASYRYGSGAYEADMEFETALDLASVRGLHVSGRGRLQGNANRIAFDLLNCADLQFVSLHAGAADYVTHTEAQLCAAPMQPLLVSDAAGWRFDTRLIKAAVKFDTAGTMLASGEARIQLAGAGAALQTGRVEIVQAVLSDAAMPARFLPVSATGAMILSGGEWRGDAAVTTHNRRIASLAIRHVMADGTGNVAVDARNVAFAPGQLQPADILPFLATFGTRVNGTAGFTGNLSWSKSGIASDGRITAAALDLQSKFGMVRRASFDLRLDSLLPVALAPRQAIMADRIDTAVPLEKLAAEFTYTPQGLTLDSASAGVAGGRIRLDPITYDFTTGWTTHAILHLENLNIQPLIDAAGLAGRVTGAATIGGDVPFAVTEQGLRFDNGHVAATGPGRLSIKREALTGGAQASPNAVQDFAYQALENMAFDALEGTIESRPMGRLGMVFRIKGRNDPPVALEARVPVIDLLRGDAFNTPLPLPKGTPVDLTLDTSLNLDELLKSYFAGFASPP